MKGESNEFLKWGIRAQGLSWLFRMESANIPAATSENVNTINMNNTAAEENIKAPVETAQVAVEV